MLWVLPLAFLLSVHSARYVKGLNGKVSMLTDIKMEDESQKRGRQKIGCG